MWAQFDDEHSLGRAARVKAARNLDFSKEKGALQGNILALFFISAEK
jgi:hypothetical protein